jgi:monoamine oxidase
MPRGRTMSHAKEETSVLILGAGAAGLAAARVFAREDVECLVLEARDRTGGRIFMAPGQDTPVALGAEFIHGKPRRTLELADEASLEIEHATQAHFRLSDGKAARFKFWEQIEDVLVRLREQPEKDRSFDAFLQQLPERMRRVKGNMTLDFVEGFHAADAHDISETSLALATKAAQESDGALVSRFRYGFSELVRFLEHSLPPSCLRLGTVVQELRWKKHHVEIQTTSRGAERWFEGRQAIVTLPLGVLKADGLPGGVRFDPPLAEKRSALGKLRMGSALRLTLDFAKPFWDTAAPDRLRFFHLRAAVPIYWTWAGPPSARLIAWMGGPRARALARADEATMITTVLHSLSLGFGIDFATLRRQLRATFWHPWDQDPYAQGAYSYIAVGGQSAQTELAGPVQQTLFFAGEATHDRHEHATVEGAIATGERAANEILRHLR